MRKTDKYTFFWRDKDIYSQWYPCKFKVNDKEFNCAEQFMMYSKALHFQDVYCLDLIMNAKHPKDQKALGRKIKGFDSKEWDRVGRTYVYTGNKFKFIQNSELLKQLLDTYPTTLVEASPYDCIWGVGLEENDPLINNEKNWKGKNYLGEVLTKLRNDLMILTQNK